MITGQVEDGSLIPGEGKAFIQGAGERCMGGVCPSESAPTGTISRAGAEPVRGVCAVGRLRDDGVRGVADGRVVGQQGGGPHLALDPQVEGRDIRFNGRA